MPGQIHFPGAGKDTFRHLPGPQDFDEETAGIDAFERSGGTRLTVPGDGLISEPQFLQPFRRQGSLCHTGWGQISDATGSVDYISGVSTVTGDLDE